MWPATSCTGCDNTVNEHDSLMTSQPRPCNVFLYGVFFPLGSILYSWQHTCWSSVPWAACSAFCHFPSTPSAAFPLPAFPCYHSAPPSLSLPSAPFSVSQTKRNYHKNNNSSQHLSLLICCPSLSQLTPYLSPYCRVCFNLTTGVAKEKKRSRHHRNIQPYQCDLLCAET